MIITDTTSAYDYDKQQWVVGPAARPILIKQLQQEIALCEGPRGGNYYASISPNNTTAEELVLYVKGLKRQLSNITA